MERLALSTLGWHLGPQTLVEKNSFDFLKPLRVYQSSRKYYIPCSDTRISTSARYLILSNPLSSTDASHTSIGNINPLIWVINRPNANIRIQ
jgi:hypothetical protein